MPRLAAADLDQLLALQLTVAWAGERAAEPPRLGWWRTDILDEAGGLDLLTRLAPRTAEWAALEAVREAARRVDERTRLRSAVPDRTVTLFHLGFDLDEQLGERLASHKRGGVRPSDALGSQLGIAADFDATSFVAWCGSVAPASKVESTPDGGRRLLSPPDAPVALVRALVGALPPLSPDYPMPHARRDLP